MHLPLQSLVLKFNNLVDAKVAKGEYVTYNEVCSMVSILKAELLWEANHNGKARIGEFMAMPIEPTDMCELEAVYIKAYKGH